VKKEKEQSAIHYGAWGGQWAKTRKKNNLPQNCGYGQQRSLEEQKCGEKTGRAVNFILTSLSQRLDHLTRQACKVLVLWGRGQVGKNRPTEVKGLLRQGARFIRGIDLKKKK